MSFLCEPVRQLIHADVSSYWLWLMRVFLWFQSLPKKQSPRQLAGAFHSSSSGFEQLFNAPRPLSGGASIHGLIRLSGKGRPFGEPVRSCLFNAMPCHAVFDNLLLLLGGVCHRAVSNRLSCNVFDHRIDSWLIAQDSKEGVIRRPVIPKIGRCEDANGFNFTAINRQCLAETKGCLLYTSDAADE